MKRKPVRPEVKPRIYFHRYDSGLGYWRVRPTEMLYCHQRYLERTFRSAAYNWCAWKNGQ